MNDGPWGEVCFHGGFHGRLCAILYPRLVVWIMWQGYRDPFTCTEPAGLCQTSRNTNPGGTFRSPLESLDPVISWISLSIPCMFRQFDLSRHHLKLKYWKLLWHCVFVPEQAVCSGLMWRKTFIKKWHLLNREVFVGWMVGTVF